MKYPSPSEFKSNFSEDALDQMAKQARATVEIHKDWSEEMKDAFSKSTYQFFGYRALFQKYAKKIKELEKNGVDSGEFQELLHQYQALQNEYNSIRSTLDALKVKFDSLQLENMNLNSQVSDLQEQLEEAQTVPLSSFNDSDNNAELEQLRQELETLKQQNEALTAQLNTSAQVSLSAELPEGATSLLKEIAMETQKQQQFSNELSFLELEKDCLSELISTIQPNDENFELPILQERFAENHKKISDLQEKLQQTETNIQNLNQTLQEDFF